MLKKLLTLALLPVCLSAQTLTQHNIQTQDYNDTAYVRQNAVLLADQETGTTADAKIAAACTALPATGGTIDARGFGGTTQSIANQISCGSATKPVTFIFDPATIFQAATSGQNIWQLEPQNVVRGFTFDCTNQPAYSGTVFQNDTSVPFLNSNNGHTTSVEDFQVTYSCRSISTGTAFKLASTSAANGVEFVSGSRFRLNGLLNGILLTASSTGYVNGNHFTDVAISSSVNGFNFNAAGGSIEGNLCVNCTYEQVSNGSYGLLWQGTTGFIRYNMFKGAIWDTSTFANLSAPASVMYGNVIDVRADGSCTGNCPGVVSDTTYNTLYNSRFAASSSSIAWGSYGGAYLTTHTGNGIHFNAADTGRVFHLFPTTGGTTGQMQLDESGVGTAAIFDGSGTGTVEAGTGGGTFWGANVYAGSGFGIAIPTISSSGYRLHLTTGTDTSGNLPKFNSLGATIDSGIAATAVPQSVASCGSTTTCSNTAQTSPRIVTGTVTLATGTATVASMTAWTSTSSFVCVGIDQTSAAAVKIVNASTTSITVTGTGTDVVAYQCVGN